MQPKLNQEHGKVKTKGQYFSPPLNALKPYVLVKSNASLLVICEAFFLHKTALCTAHFCQKRWWFVLNVKQRSRLGECSSDGNTQLLSLLAKVFKKKHPQFEIFGAYSFPPVWGGGG